ncbi:MAG TPA: hypothetical protein VFV67_20260 [Actinophytocola sp.]|uniref:hypothetical protein n=1 Tax=Actinophytocola sp. TaxID=1872138 RepID=UPI002DC05EC9|nr:hypothetical protein [Actinophytocola sp.]HEU5472986.1 hypothetical protein [Actinophytocola sp.]
MDALVLACGPVPSRPGWVAVPERPGRADLDPLLAAGPDRVVVAGTDADLAAVVLRLLRAERLDLPVGYVPAVRSVAASVWRLPADALGFALAGPPARLPLIRDDSGGVLVGLGRIGPVDGEAYCDDQLALRGRAARIEARPDPAGGVCGRVVPGGLRRAREFRGRALQVGCHPAAVVSDGVPHDRPVRRFTWYRHTEDLRAIALPG